MNHTTAVHPHAGHGSRIASHRIVARRRRVLSRAAVTEGERERVAAAFRSLANGVDSATASVRTNDFYRSSGMDWARCLS